MFGGNKVDYVQLSSLCSTFIDGDWIESKDQSESGIRLIQTGNVGCGEYKDKGDKAKYITEDTFNKLHCTEIYPGDILISRLPDPVGRACVLPEGLGKCVTAVDCTIIRFSEKILPNFFVAYTNTPEYLTQIKSTLAGTTRLRVSRGNLGKVKIPVPSIEQQRTFVSIAEQADKSKFMRSKSQFIEMFGTLDNHPAEYAVKTLRDLSECYAGATPSTKVKEYWDNGSIPWMSSGEVHMEHVTETESKITESGYQQTSTKMVPVHSVVIALAGQGKTRGKVAITEIPLCTNQSLCAIVPSKDIHYEYLYHNLKGRYLELRGMAGDVNGRGGLNLKIVQSIQVIVPPIDEQMKFVAIAQQADKSKFELKQSIEAIDKVIKSLINENL
jgi:type I restriction enzyme S subunit